MNKFFRFLAILLLGAVFLPSCSKQQADEKGKPLIVVCEASTSPYCYYRGKTAIPSVGGVDIDIIEEIGKELGRPVQYRTVPFQQIFSLISQGKADIGAAGITITQERAERVLFSGEYDVASQVIVVPKNSAIADESMLKNARVAAQEGTSDLTLLRERIQPHSILPFLTQEDVNAALVNNRADAAVMDRMQAELLVKATGDTFKILNKSLSEDKYGLVFNKKNTALAEAANKVIDRLKKDGSIAKSRTQHLDAVSQLGTGAKVQEEVKPLILCVESSFAPFVFWDNQNHLVGADIEIAEAIAAELKRPLIINVVPFIDVIPLVESKAADMGASGITITKERAERVLFSIPYKEGGRRILVRDDATFERLEDLSGKVIGAKKGTTNEAFAVEKLHARETCHYDNAAQGIQGLIAGEIDAYVDDEMQADLAEDKYIGQIKSLGIALPEDAYGFVLQKGDDQLKAVADKVISEKRGELEKLFEKYSTLSKEVDAAGF